MARIGKTRNRRTRIAIVTGVVVALALVGYFAYRALAGGHVHQHRNEHRHG